MPPISSLSSLAHAEPWDRFWAVIPAGGAGTRLWPVSRSARPKFLLPLHGPLSLLQQTAARVRLVVPPERTIVVCGPGHAAAVARQLPELPDANIVVEPAPKGSGPAIALAAALIDRHDPGATMGSFAADHDVQDDTAWSDAVATAIVAARDDWLVAIGLTPDRPETGYGYVERGDETVATSPTGTAYRATSFVEKPDHQRAEQYVASGRFLWNASMFVWRPAALLAEIARHQPDLHRGLRRVAAAWGRPEQDAVTAEVWASLPVSTIDEGVMERAGRVAVVPASMAWCDVGDWDVLGQLTGADTEGNVLQGDVIPVATTHSTVWSETKRLIATVGLDNVVIVDTDDALLVADRSHSQEVREVVKVLKERQRDELT